MKTISLILLVFIITSCASQKRCYTKFPPQIKTEYSVKDSTVYRDTTIYVKLPSDTVNKTDTIFITESGGELSFSLDTLKTASNYATAYTWITPTLKRHLTIQDKDTTLLIRLDNAIKERNRFEQLLKVQEFKAPPVKFCSFWSKLKFLLIGILIGYVLRIVQKLFNLW